MSKVLLSNGNLCESTLNSVKMFCVLFTSILTRMSKMSLFISFVVYRMNEIVKNLALVKIEHLRYLPHY